MCWACNPMCGGCQPPRKRMVPCPQCGHFTLVDLQVTLNPIAWECETCGFDITSETIPTPRYCLRFEVECANPCGYRVKLFQTENRGTCQFHRPLLEGQAIDENDPLVEQQEYLN